MLLVCRGERPAPGGAWTASASAPLTTGPEDDAEALASYPEAVEPAALATCQAGARRAPVLTLSEAESIRGHASACVPADSSPHCEPSTLVCCAV